MKKYFVTGLIFLLPLALTTAIVIFIVNFLTQPFVGFVENLLKSYQIHSQGFIFLNGDQILRYGSQILILISLFLFTVVLGLITRWFFINYLIKLSDYVLHRIPFINKLYKTSQDIIRTLFLSQTNSFKQVVMVPFPAKNNFCIGLVTREAPPICQEAAGADLVSVFVPTTPNPTSGYLLMFEKKDLHYLDMKTEDAIKFIISCGVIYPGAPELETKSEIKAHENTNPFPKEPFE